MAGQSFVRFAVLVLLALAQACPVASQPAPNQQTRDGSADPDSETFPPLPEMPEAPVDEAESPASEILLLNDEVVRLYAEGDYDQAVVLAARAVELQDKLDNPDAALTGTLLHNLAVLYESQERYPEAERAFRRSLEVREKALGDAHIEIAKSLMRLAIVEQRQQRHDEAEKLYLRALAMREKLFGPEAVEVADTLDTLAEFYSVRGRKPEAEAAYKRALALQEKAAGPESMAVALAANNLSVFYLQQARYGEAQQLAERALAIAERQLQPQDRALASYVGNLSELYRVQGRFAEAEHLAKRALAIGEAAYGPDHTEVGEMLSTLALIYEAREQFAEAEALYRRNLAILEKARGPSHADLVLAISNLATPVQGLARYAEAEELYKRALAIAETTMPADDYRLAFVLNNFAELYRNSRRPELAEPLYRRSLAIREKRLGLDHPEIAVVLNNLGLVHRAQKKHAEAEADYQRSLAIRLAALGPDHPLVASSLNNSAWLAAAQGHWTQAADYWQRSTDLIARRVRRGLTDGDKGGGQAETARNAWQYEALIKVKQRLAGDDRKQRDIIAGEVFQTAQWALASDAAASLMQMAARNAQGDARLAALVRERQDLVGEWQAKDKLLIAARARAAAERDADAQRQLSDRLAAIDRRLAEIDQRLAVEFPNHAALASPAPASVADARAVLRDDEALVLILDTSAGFEQLPAETFVWVVTKSDMRWITAGLGSEDLKRDVAALRCGLDATAWDGDGKQTCLTLLKLPVTDAPDPDAPLPFDAARAHKLYAALFGGAEDLLKDKHLLIVPSGPLTQLPFNVLLTAPPQDSDYRQMPWLPRQHALTVLPSVSSLVALRRASRASAATRPMIGFGNPLLDGDQAHPVWGDAYRQMAAQARQQTGCADRRELRTTSLRAMRRAVGQMSANAGTIDPAELKIQAPLPETADELCAVARALKAGNDAIRIGARATETEVKALSDSGTLAQFRIIQFATHGTLAGQLSPDSEPGLILTPPTAASAADDGYLSASEIAGLNLDADWVILSACNTAGGAGAGDGAEALSGLAQAFFYAQARALLVSHWEVDSAATVDLVTAAVEHLVSDKKGRADAMRQAMLKLIDDSATGQAHPSRWAPFVVVGEGAVWEAKAP